MSSSAPPPPPTPIDDGKPPSLPPPSSNNQKPSLTPATANQKSSSPSPSSANQKSSPPSANQKSSPPSANQKPPPSRPTTADGKGRTKTKKKKGAAAAASAASAASAADGASDSGGGGGGGVDALLGGGGSSSAVSVAASASSVASSGGPLDRENMRKIRQAMELLQLQEQQDAAAKTEEDAKKKSFDFWSTQPVPKIDEEVTDGFNEAIQADVPTEKVRAEPYTLPTGYHWDTLNLDDPLILKELYVLLNENYVEDDDNMFRFDYSPEFLRWALQPPGWRQDWHCGVKTKANKLVGFISAVPATAKVYDKVKEMVEINFLCVHKKLRSKRLAPVLIKEITRRVNVKGLFQAVYTAGVVLPKPVATCRYWHRSLNPKKLIEVKFSHLSRNMTMQRHLKLYKLPEETKIERLRPLTVDDVPKACELLNDYLREFDLAPSYSEREFCHWFLPREDIVDSFVVETPPRAGGGGRAITDLISFYTLPSTVMSHPQYNKLKAAYSFYNVARTVSWVELMQDALVLAKKADFDVFNALDLMENVEFLEKLKFGIGDGNLQYYLYNWRCPTMQPRKVGLVLQ